MIQLVCIQQFQKYHLVILVCSCIKHFFNEMMHLVCNYKKPPVKFTVDCLVGKYARPVLYYIAGWMLYSASKALTVAKDKRPTYYRFEAMHSIMESEAKMMVLPTSLVERRKQKLSVYCTQQYFEFICFVEIVYFANLSLKMMSADKDGNIISVIKMSILSNTGAWGRFDALFLSNVVQCERQCVMAYIMERYANIRGTFFVRHLKCNIRNLHGSSSLLQCRRDSIIHDIYCMLYLFSGIIIGCSHSILCYFTINDGFHY
jgi:hypothetical protein